MSKVVTNPTKSDQKFKNEEKTRHEKKGFRLSEPVSPSGVSLRPERGFDRAMSPPNLKLDINPPSPPVVSEDSDEDSWTTPPSSPRAYSRRLFFDTNEDSGISYESRSDDSPPSSETGSDGS